MNKFTKILPEIPSNIRTLFWNPKKKNFGKFDLVDTGKVSPPREIPNHIPKPSYYNNGIPITGPSVPEIKNKEQISRMRDSCTLAANILKTVGDTLKVGQTTDEIDVLVHRMAIENNAYPSPLRYKNFPKSVCTSVNNVACHGIPDDRPLHDGDIINIDITVFYNGFHGDCSKTFMVGNVDDVGKELVNVTELCVSEVISKLCGPGVPFRYIGAFVQERAKELGFNIVPAFVGHGIGEYFHGAPDIYHIRNSYPGNMEPGMTFTIEPVLTCGDEDIYILDDEWTAVTADCSRTAQFEHTILITEDGAEILTIPDSQS